MQVDVGSKGRFSQSLKLHHVFFLSGTTLLLYSYSIKINDLKSLFTYFAFELYDKEAKRESKSCYEQLVTYVTRAFFPFPPSLQLFGLFPSLLLFYFLHFFYYFYKYFNSINLSTNHSTSCKSCVVPQNI